MLHRELGLVQISSTVPLNSEKIIFEIFMSCTWNNINRLNAAGMQDLYKT